MGRRKSRKVKVKLNKIILQVLLLILVSIALITQKENILNILTNKNRIKAGIPGDMNVGDTIEYNHKAVKNGEDLKTTLKTAYTNCPEQTIDAKDIDTTWSVWEVNRGTGEIAIISDKSVAPFSAKGANGYLYHEYNMYKVASIFGHGAGANTEKVFSYKIGNESEHTTKSTGNSEVPASGARPLSIEEVISRVGIDKRTFSTDSKTMYGYKPYGYEFTEYPPYPSTIYSDGIVDGGGSSETFKQTAFSYTADRIRNSEEKKIIFNGESYALAEQMVFKTADVSTGYGHQTIIKNEINPGIITYMDVHNDHGGAYSIGDKYETMSTNIKNTVPLANPPSRYYTQNIRSDIRSRVVVYMKNNNTYINKSTSSTEKIWKINVQTPPSTSKSLPQGMQIGDIVKYNHKDVLRIEDGRKNIAEISTLKTIIKKGTASIPGSTYKQDFDANKIDTNWHVWGVDEVTGDVIIVSDSVAPFKTYGAIDYIWYEHNMHKIASIFGYGKGTKKKKFEYKVGSQLEDTGDTATWKTGIDGIPLTRPKGIPGITTKERLKDIVVPLSGARPLRTKDIEKAFSWTESIIKRDSKFKKATRYGGIYTIKIHFPQRDTAWVNKNIVKAAEQDVRAKFGHYWINKSNVPENNYKNVLWDWNSNSSYQLGQVGLDVSLSEFDFRRGMVGSDDFNSANGDFVRAGINSFWYEDGNTMPGRVLAFLSSSDIIYRKTNDVGAHQEPVWDIELKNNPSKNIKVNMKNEYGKNLSGVKFNLGVDGGASVLSRANLNINSGTVYSFNQSNVVMKANKHKMEVLGLPDGAGYGIISKYGNVHELTQDIVSFEKEDLEYDILIYRKDGDYVVPVTYEGGKNDEDFSLSGKIKLMDGQNIVKTLKDVTLKSGNNEFKFTDVKYFVNGKFKNYTIKYEGEGNVSVIGNGLKVKYTPPKKNYTIKAEFIFDKTLDTVPVELHADGKFKKDINLLKSKDYIHVENLPARDDSGKVITYTIKKGNIPSGYITEISGLKIIIRPVLTLPMSGSDSIKLVGITAGICIALGAMGRFKNKLIIFFKKYEIMK